MLRNGRKVIVVGGANIDIQGKPAAAYLPGDSNPGLVRRSLGGVGRNIAENLARLGMKVELVAPIGRDAEGERLITDCRAKGIGTSHCFMSESPSSTYLCLLNESGGLVGAVSDMKAMDELTPAWLLSLEAFILGADYLVADANLPRDSLAWIARTFGLASAPAGARPRLYLDPVSRTKAQRLFGITGNFDCMKPNRAEALLLAGIEDGAPEALCDAMEKCGNLPPELFMSMGGEGMFYRTEKGVGRVALPDSGQIPVVNRSGAGDAACAALLWSEAEGFEPRQRTEFALTASILTASCPEPVHPGIGAVALKALRKNLFPKENNL